MLRAPETRGAVVDAGLRDALVVLEAERAGGNHIPVLALVPEDALWLVNELALLDARVALRGASADVVIRRFVARIASEDRPAGARTPPADESEGRRPRTAAREAAAEILNRRHALSQTLATRLRSIASGRHGRDDLARAHDVSVNTIATQLRQLYHALGLVGTARDVRGVLALLDGTWAAMPRRL